ncbi:MAG: RluA family pseudouridine synthase [Bacillota bacterium]
MNNDTLYLSVDETGEGSRLDQFVSTKLEDYSRAQIKRFIKEGHVTVDGETKKAGYTLKEGEAITVIPIEEEPLDLTPKDVAFDVVYEDDAIMIVDKPSGLVVHPSKTYRKPTLVHGVLNHLKDPDAFERKERAGIVHRIDKDTSGLLVVAKTPESLKTLQSALKNHEIKRSYIALCDGVIPHNKGTINAPIGRHEKKRKQMTVKEGGKKSITHFTVIERFADHTLVKLNLETGRTHQIRAHLSYINFPIVGDPTYGLKRYKDEGFNQFLHAAELTLTHPVSGETLTFETKLPDIFEEKLNALRKTKS